MWCCSQTNVVKLKMPNAHNSFAEKHKIGWLFFSCRVVCLAALHGFILLVICRVLCDQYPACRCSISAEGNFLVVNVHWDL